MSNLKQEYTSKDTCINTVSAIYKQVTFGLCEVILDYGGGKYNTNAEYMRETRNCEVLVYDPYNRSYKNNKEILDYFTRKPARNVVCSNVLNVIKEDEVILGVLRHIYSLMDKGGFLYIKVYERDKSRVGCVTTKGWQRNQKLVDYIPFIEKAFGKHCQIEKKKDILIIKKL
jgi:hypothetical protein